MTTEDIQFSINSSGIRSIHELMELKSYSEMNDAEINSLIKYYIEYAKKSEELRTKQAILITQMNEEIEIAKEQAKKSDKDFKDALARPLNLIKIEGGNNES